MTPCNHSQPAPNRQEAILTDRPAPQVEDSNDGHYVYLASCADGTLYTGYTINVDRRLAAHNAGLGARYTRSRRPISLLASWSFDTKAEALRAEYEIKQLPRTQKLALANGTSLPTRWRHSPAEAPP